jgi:hypothetical protein
MPHISTDGHRCGSICLRGEPFCHYHHTTRSPAPRKTFFGSHASFDLTLPKAHRSAPNFQRTGGLEENNGSDVVGRKLRAISTGYGG